MPAFRAEENAWSVHPRLQKWSQAPGSYGADSTVQTASEVIFRWFGRMVSQGGEGAPCASLVQVLEGYEVNGCPHCRHCDQIVRHLELCPSVQFS